MHWIVILAISVVVIAILILVAWVGLGRFIAVQMLSQQRNRCEGVERPEDRGFDTHRFWIPVDEQHRLHAWIIHPGPQSSTTDSTTLPCVVMVHGFSSHKDCRWTFSDEPDYAGSMLDQGADSLCHAGFCVVAIDLRNHGQSDTNGFVTLGQDEAEDVLATLTYLQSHASELRIDVNRIGLRGESMGAVTCMIAAARQHSQSQQSKPKNVPPCIRALWCDSPFADAHRVVGDFMAYAGINRRLAPPVRFWLNRMTGRDFHHSSPTRYAHQIECPTLIVHSVDDPMIGIDHFEELQSLEWKTTPEFWRLSEHGHNRLWIEPGYQERQIDFFRQHLA